MKEERKSNLAGRIKESLFYIFILFFFIGFNFQDTQTGGWTRQFITAPISSAPLNGIDFKDSLVGYSITNLSTTQSDTNYILKTTNGGFNWSIIFSTIESRGFDIKSLNKDTVYIGTDVKIYRTYNGGQNWTAISLVGYGIAYSIYVLNTDTMWYACPGPAGLGGGLWRTTDQGVSWQQQSYYISGVNGYPEYIYMYNRNIGFMGTDNGELLKTTNCGVNWTKIYTSVYIHYTDMYFKDSLTGFLASVELYKTTNGGVNWQSQALPTIPGSNYTDKSINKFSLINDTIYTVFSKVNYPNNQSRAVIYKSTNGGLNWGYQIPDTSYHISGIFFIKFISGKKGWCYRTNPEGIITYTGGDSTIYTGINNNLASVTNDFVLFQNYPNPFNPATNIKYKIEKTSSVKIIVFDISGKEIRTLINKKQSKGDYEVRFDGNVFSSGVYFYSFFVDNNRIDTKKMIMIK
jgi:hypothetical protein